LSRTEQMFRYDYQHFGNDKKEFANQNKKSMTQTEL